MPHSSHQWCPRCGEPVESSGAPCSSCWECEADQATVKWLIGWARDENRAAISCLGRIRDPRATSALRIATCDTSPQLRSAALVSLGRSGAPDDAAPLATALHDSHADVRRAARLALAELGGAEARDRLAATLQDLNGAELDQAIDALAWLDDARALSFAHARLDALPRTIYRTPGFRIPGWALVRLGGREDLMRIRNEGYAAAQLK